MWCGMFFENVVFCEFKQKNVKLCKIGRKGSFYSSFFIHMHVKKMHRIYT